MALSYNLGYQESISVHPTRRQNFAGKPYSNFPNIWEWLLYALTMIFTTTAVYPLGEKLWGCRRSTALYLLWGHCPLKHKNLGSLKSLPELNWTHKLTMAVQGLNNCLTLSNLELTKDHVLQARMLWFFIRRHKCRKCVLSQKQGVLCHLFDVLHVLHVLYTLQTYAMFYDPRW